MPSPVVVLAHAPSNDALAQRISDELKGLGYAVQRGAGVGRDQAARIEAAQRVVVLWSSAARGTPALRAAVRRARARGTLVCVPVDAAPPPPGAQALTRLPGNPAAWRKALSAKRVVKTELAPARAHSRPARARIDPALRITKEFPMSPLPKPPRRDSTRGAAIFAVVLIAAMAGTFTYYKDAAFAANVNALAEQARTMAENVVRSGG